MIKFYFLFQIVTRAKIQSIILSINRLNIKMNKSLSFRVRAQRYNFFWNTKNYRIFVTKNLRLLLCAHTKSVEIMHIINN